MSTLKLILVDYDCHCHCHCNLTLVIDTNFTINDINIKINQRYHEKPDFLIYITPNGIVYPDLTESFVLSFNRMPDGTTLGCTSKQKPSLSILTQLIDKALTNTKVHNLQNDVATIATSSSSSTLNTGELRVLDPCDSELGILGQLPEEVILHILCHTPIEDLQSLAVCNKFYRQRAMDRVVLQAKATELNFTLPQYNARGEHASISDQWNLLYTYNANTHYTPRGNIYVDYITHRTLALACGDMTVMKTNYEKLNDFERQSFVHRALIKALDEGNLLATDYLWSMYDKQLVNLNYAEIGNTMDLFKAAIRPNNISYVNQIFSTVQINMAQEYVDGDMTQLKKQHVDLLHYMFERGLIQAIDQNNLTMFYHLLDQASPWTPIPITSDIIAVAAKQGPEWLAIYRDNKTKYFNHEYEEGEEDLYMWTGMASGSQHRVIVESLLSDIKSNAHKFRAEENSGSTDLAKKLYHCMVYILTRFVTHCNVFDFERMMTCYTNTLEMIGLDSNTTGESIYSILNRIVIKLIIRPDQEVAIEIYKYIFQLPYIVASDNIDYRLYNIDHLLYNMGKYGRRQMYELTKDLLVSTQWKVNVSSVIQGAVAANDLHWVEQLSESHNFDDKILLAMLDVSSKPLKYEAIDKLLNRGAVVKINMYNEDSTIKPTICRMIICGNIFMAQRMIELFYVYKRSLFDSTFMGYSSYGRKILKYIICILCEKITTNENVKCPVYGHFYVSIITFLLKSKYITLKNYLSNWISAMYFSGPDANVMLSHITEELIRQKIFTVNQAFPFIVSLLINNNRDTMKVTLFIFNYWINLGANRMTILKKCKFGVDDDLNWIITHFFTPNELYQAGIISSKTQCTLNLNVLVDNISEADYSLEASSSQNI